MNKKLYFNGNIITLDKQNNIFNCIYTENEIIKFVGNINDFDNFDKDIQKINLNGNTIIPAFIDAHSHFTSYAQTLALVNLSHCTNFKDIQNTLKKHIEKNNIKKGEWIVAFNYDHENLEEKTHPTKFVIDEVLKDYPVLLTHVSGHMGVINSKGLDILGITKDTKNVEGGEILRIEGSKEPNGILLENAFIKNAFKVPTPTLEDLLKFLEKTQDDYFSFGITTCQDGFTKINEFNLLKTFANSEKLKIDVVSYVDIKNNKNVYLENKDTYGKKYINHYKLGGYKMFLDGSPQAKTAWVSKPYLNSNEYGISTLKDDEVLKFIKQALKDDAQIITHCNGDAAAQQLIDNFKLALKENDKEKTNTRPVMIHAQLIREEQLEEMKKIGMIPSFFNAHTFFWGDIHIKNLGLERASKISPMKSALEKNIIFTIHQDTPVINPNMIHSIWCAVNRITKNGVSLGTDEEISPLEALKACTINAAKQYFEEDKKGSLEIGKLADLVILDKNILEIDKNKIKDVKILETIKCGESVYKNN